MKQNLLILPDGTELFCGAEKTNAIRSFTYTESVNAGTELALGSSCAACVEAAIIAPDGGLTIGQGAELVYLQVSEDGTREQIGLFTAEKPTKAGAGTYKLTAYDRITWLDKDLSAWLASLDSWPYTLLTFSKMVCAECGLTLKNETLLNGDYLIQQFFVSQVTGRKLIQWAGEVSASFVRADKDGKVEFAWYAHGQSIGTGDYYAGSLSYEDYETAAIEKVHVRQGEDDIGVLYPDTEADNTYVIANNPLLTTFTEDTLKPVAKSIYSVVSQIRYTPCKVSTYPWIGIKAGDIVDITDGNGNKITSYIMTRMNTGKNVLESTGSARRDSVTNVNQQSYRELYGRMLNLKKGIDGVSLELKESKRELKSADEEIVETVEKNRAALEVYVDGISAEVSKQSQDLEIAKEEMTAIRQAASEVSIQIQSILDNGVDKVKTGMGYTFDDSGLNIEKSGEEIKNKLDHTGMHVGRPDEEILSATADGVKAIDVTVRNFLTVGHSRLEAYSDGTDGDRTACFFV